jgi:nitronate monooxygenase
MALASIRDLFGIELAIIQAPMAGVQDSALAVAVSNAGGLGSLPGAMLTPAGLRAEIQAIRRGTSKPFNVNFFCHTTPPADPAREAAWREALAPYYAELGLETGAPAAGAARAPFSAEIADALEDDPPPVVSFHFGLPPPELLARVASWRSKILGCATTVEEAHWLESRGVDAIVAQGLEAGGHRGHFLSNDLTLQSGTLALVPQIAAAVRVPVIAAGGIADHAGAAAAADLGAAGVQVGTAYLLCPEATTSAVHRAALKSPAARHTQLTTVFSGRPARGIVNRLMRELGALPANVPAFPLAAAAVAPLRAKAESQAAGHFSPLWSGQNASGLREIGAAELTRQLAARSTD